MDCQCPGSGTSAPSSSLSPSLRFHRRKPPAAARVGEWCTPSLYSLGGHCLTWTPTFLSPAYSSVWRITPLDLHTPVPEGPLSVSSPLRVFFPPGPLFLQAPCCLPSEPSLTSSGTGVPHRAHTRLPPRTLHTLLTHRSSLHIWVHISTLTSQEDMTLSK